MIADPAGLAYSEAVIVVSEIIVFAAAAAVDVAFEAAVVTSIGVEVGWVVVEAGVDVAFEREVVVASEGIVESAEFVVAVEP